MANVTITDLSAGSALGGSELFEIVQTGASVKTTATAIKTFTNTSAVISGGSLSGVTISSASISASSGSFASLSITTGAIPFNTITSFVSGQATSTRDQTAAAINTAYPISFDYPASWNNGFSISNSTNIIFAVAGTYQFALNLQWANSDTTNHSPRVWLEKGGTAISNSAFTMNVPKAADGGISLSQVTIQDQFTAGQTLVIYWNTDNTGVRLDYTAASGTIPAVPAAVFNVTRVA